MFYQVYQHLSNYTTQGKFDGWLKRIAVNRAKNFLRDYWRETVTGAHVAQDCQAEDSDFDPQLVLLSRLLQQEIRAALQALNDEQRQVIVECPSMNDEIILRMLQDAGQKLENIGGMFPVETPHIVPVYNALLAAVKANHPDEPYLQALAPIEGQAGPEELRVLFGQLRILVEAKVEADDKTRPLAR